jgi:hypothetical protein
VRSTRIRIASVLVGLVAAVSLAAPASANPCGQKLWETCNKIEQEASNLVCYLTRKCL